MKLFPLEFKASQLQKFFLFFLANIAKWFSVGLWIQSTRVQISLFAPFLNFKCCLAWKNPSLWIKKPYCKLLS